jgi:predicted MFS family arabinose efflux permease
MVGNALIFPFFAMFMTDRFNVSMARVGVIFGIYAVAGVIGGTIGGALTDRFGRKHIALSGLVFSALGNLAIGLNTNFNMMYVLAAALGTIGSIGGPAWHAMMADLLPEEKRAEGFSVIRIAFNLAVTFGPMIGGLLAGISYVVLFSVDALTSFITAAILIVFLRETRPEKKPGEAPQESLAQTFKGYGRVVQDRVFMTFVLLGIVVWLVYMQMNTTLAVFLRDEHGLEPQGFGILLSLNAITVVVSQLYVTRWLRKRGYPAMLIMAAGVVLYGLGFALYGFVAGFMLFVMAMMIITIGEMVVVPTGQSIVARLAPEDMRGRYMALMGYSYAIASGMGTWLAGQVIKNMGFDWVWYFSGILAAITALAYVMLHYFVNVPMADEVSFAEAAAD